MRLPILFTALLGSAALAAAPASGPLTRTAPLKAANGKTIGRVTLTDAPNGVLLRVEADGLTPGWHGLHLHEKADCSDSAFKKSGGHVHGGHAAVHGLLNPAATDQGDLPNIHADAQGKAAAEFFSTRVALHPGAGGRADLLDADGSALVIHAAPDDFRSQPIGGAGARVACAAVK